MALPEYNSTSNAPYIRIKKGKVAESEPISGNPILDLNKKGEIIGVEDLGPTPIDITKFSRPIKIATKKHNHRTDQTRTIHVTE